MTPQIPWLRVLVEGVVIVGSILLALAADAWLQERQDRAEELDWLERLAAEFAVVDSEHLVVWRANHEGVMKAAEALLEHTGPTRAASLSADSIGALVWAINFTWTVDPPTGTLSSLESSGRLDLIQNEEIQMHLASWRSDLEDLQNLEQTMHRYAYEILQPYLNSHVGYRSVSAYSGDTVYARAPSRFPDGLTGVLADREFESHVEVRRTDATAVLTKYDALRANVSRITSLLDHELAR